MQMLYWDSYQRVNGTWLFKKRLPMYWYATDLNKPPLGDKKMRWPDEESYEGFFHDLFPSWKEFWSSDYIRDNDVSEPVEANKFLKAIRRGSEPGKLKKQDAADNVKPEVEPKIVKEEKKRLPKKLREKKVVENTDTKDKQENEENSNQKRKGWWSLKG